MLNNHKLLYNNVQKSNFVNIIHILFIYLLYLHLNFKRKLSKFIVMESKKIYRVTTSYSKFTSETYDFYDIKQAFEALASVPFPELYESITITAISLW